MGISITIIVVAVLLLLSTLLGRRGGTSPGVRRLRLVLAVGALLFAFWSLWRTTQDHGEADARTGAARSLAPAGGASPAPVTAAMGGVR